MRKDMDSLDMVLLPPNFARIFELTSKLHEVLDAFKTMVNNIAMRQMTTHFETGTFMSAEFVTFPSFPESPRVGMWQPVCVCVAFQYGTLFVSVWPSSGNLSVSVLPSVCIVPKNMYWVCYCPRYVVISTSMVECHLDGVRVCPQWRSWGHRGGLS